VARKAGKARWGALATHSLNAMMPQLTAPGSPIDVVMMTYNHTSSSDDEQNLATLHSAGLGITPMKPLAGRFYKETSDDSGPHLRWLVADPRVHTIPVGMKTIAHVEQNVSALRTTLSDADRETLKSQLAFTSARFCRMCGTCDGRCAGGLAVNDVVRSVMYAEGYSDLAMARSHFAAIPEEQRRMACHNCTQCTVHCPKGVAIRERMQRAMELLC